VSSLAAIRDAIRTTIVNSGIGIEVYDTVPEVAVVPAVVVIPFDADFTVTMGRGTDSYNIDLFVLCSRAVADQGQDDLDSFATGAGTSSVREAIWNNKTLGLSDVNAHIAGMNRYGGQFETAQIPHVGAVLRLVVMTSGTS
jgi:hypothetical protein